MRKDLLTIFIVVAVLAVCQIVGGVVYTVYTARKDASFDYYDCTIVEIETEKVETDTEDGEEQFTIKSVKVQYTLSDGTEVEAYATQYPSSLAVGTEFVGRVSRDSNSLDVSAETTDWFTPIFMIALGVVYAIIDLLFFIFRKKTGLYALKDVSNEYVEIEEDDWTIADNADKAVVRNDDYASHK